MLKRSQTEGVATLTLARPERGNALGPDLVEALLDALQVACADATVHTLLLRSEGRHFCTGLDLSDLDRCSDGDLLQRLVRIETLLAALWHAPLRTVALAQGRAWGAGADLFAACEHRLASEGTTFRFPGAQFGIVLGTRRLADRVGADRARAMTTGGGEWRAAEAQAAGLVQAVVVDGDAGAWAWPVPHPWSTPPRRKRCARQHGATIAMPTSRPWCARRPRRGWWRGWRPTVRGSGPEGMMLPSPALSRRTR
jgi:enoyl-CoA hydratase